MLISALFAALLALLPAAALAASPDPCAAGMAASACEASVAAGTAAQETAVIIRDEAAIRRLQSALAAERGYWARWCGLVRGCAARSPAAKHPAAPR